MAHINVMKDKKGQFRFNVVANNGEIVATSESYKQKPAAMKAIAMLKAAVRTAKVIDKTEPARPAKSAKTVAKKAAKAPAKKPAAKPVAKAVAKPAAKVAAKPAPKKAFAKKPAPAKLAPVVETSPAESVPPAETPAPAVATESPASDPTTT
jgi:uncharacterized protein YegP (UPF0339 family)